MNKYVFSKVDYEGSLEQLINAASKDPTFKDYNMNGSGLKAIARMIALSDSNKSFQLNMAFNEAHMNTAEMYENVASAASFKSYTPNSILGATMNIDIVVVPPTSVANPPNTISIGTANKFMASKDGFSFQFAPLTTHTATLSNGEYLFSAIPIRQGRWLYNTFSVASDNIETYVIPNADIDINTLSVFVQSGANNATTTEFTRYTRPQQLVNGSNLYYLEFGRDGKYTIEFGDGQFSNAVTNGDTIHIQYMTTKGAEGNGIITVTPAGLIGGFGNIQISPVTGSSGGAERESIASIKRRSNLGATNAGSLIGDEACGERLLAVRPDLRAVSWGGQHNTPPKNGSVIVAVEGPNTTLLTAQEKTDLEVYLQQFMIGSIKPRVIDPKYVRINAVVNVVWNAVVTALTENELSQKVSGKVATYAQDNWNNFTVEVDVNDFVNSMKEVSTSIHRIKAVFNFEYDIPLTSGRPVNTVVNFPSGVENVVISGFEMEADVNTIHELYDVDGILKMRSISGGGVVTDLVGEFGTVDRANGVVKIAIIPTNTGTMTVTADTLAGSQYYESGFGEIWDLGLTSVNMEVIQ